MNFGTIGDVSSLIGCLIGVAGFGITIYLLRKSASAVEAARQASAKTLANVRRIQHLSDVHEAMDKASELQELHREKSWKRCLSNYHIIKVCLIRIREGKLLPDSKHQRALQNALSHLTMLERSVEEVINAETEEDIPRYNDITIRVRDTLETLGSALVSVEGER